MRMAIEVTDGVVVNRSELPDDMELPKGWFYNDSAQIGWKYENGKYVEPVYEFVPIEEDKPVANVEVEQTLDRETVGLLRRVTLGVATPDDLTRLSEIENAEQALLKDIPKVV